MLFTKIAKGTLWAYIIIGIVASIITSSVGNNHWWIAPVGIAITFVSSSICGTFVEISEHTYETKELLLRMNAESDVSDNKRAPAAKGNNQVESEMNKDRIAPQKVNDEAVPPRTWYCPNCGMQNHCNDLRCLRCGQITTIKK